VLNLVAVGTQDNALRDFPLNDCEAEAASDQLGHFDGLLVGALMVELEGTGIGEPAMCAGVLFLVVIHPLAEASAARASPQSFASATFEAAVDFGSNHSTDLKPALWARQLAGLADPHESG
jgi:hypothetical protein